MVQEQGQGTWEDRGLDDDHDAVLDDVAVLLLVGLLNVGRIDDFAVAADARILVDDALPHLRIGACMRTEPHNDFSNFAPEA